MLARLTQLLICICILFAILILGQEIIVPLVFAVIMACIISPLYKELLRIFKHKIGTLLIAFLFVFIPLIGIGALAIFQLQSIVSDMPAFEMDYRSQLQKSLEWIKSSVPGSKKLSVSDLEKKIMEASQSMITYLGGSVATTITVIANIFLTILYSFFILYYGDYFKDYLRQQFQNSAKDTFNAMYDDCINIIRNYISGLGMVMVILAVLNTIGLYLLGVEYAIFWGSLGAVLAVIPYIGTVLGGLFPMLFAWITMNDPYVPLWIALYYIFIQQVEGNFITPYIVGEKVNLNPLFAILAVIFFGFIWGISGAIVALPLLGITKTIMSYIKPTFTLSLLMGENLNEMETIQKYDKKQEYKLMSLLVDKNK